MAVDPHKHYSQFTVKANGQYLPATQKRKIVSVVVEQNLHLPSMAVVTFRDSSLDPAGSDPLHLDLVNQNVLPIGASIEIAMGMEASPEPVFKGEVTAHEVDIRHGSLPMLVVRAYDKAHRLQRGRISKTYLNVTDSDIVSRIASSAGLRAEAASTSNVYKYVLQNNQTNWEFLQDRAGRIGYEVFVDGEKLVFRKPKTTGSAQLSAKLFRDILHLNLRMTSAGQINGVTVKSWDPSAKQAITGEATDGLTTASGGQQQFGSDLAQPFGTSSKMILARRPATSQSEADALAQAAADELSASAMHLQGEVPGNPGLKAGQLVDLATLGPRFSGKYYVTVVTHRFNASGEYTTRFELGGRRPQSLLDLVSAGNSQQQSHGGGPAVVVGIVTNNQPQEGDGNGLVKVKFPWLADAGGTEIESTWARLVAPSAGNGRGFQWIPEKDDEVLVAFEHGDVHRPFIIGALWNGQDAPPKSASDAVDSGTSKVNLRVMKSRSGHTITLDDTEGTENVTVVSKSGHTIKLDDPNGSETVTIKDKSGNNSFVIETASNKITITAQGDIDINATQDVNITGMNISIKANSQATMQGTESATVQGATCSVTGDESVSVSGPSVSISGEASIDVSGGAVSVSGEMISLGA